MSEPVAVTARRVVLAGASVVVVTNVAVWLAGASPRRVLWLLAEGTFGSGYGIGQTLAKATPLVCTGMAVAFGLRAGMFNIGAEGQAMAGVLAAAVVGQWLPAGTPAVLAVPVCVAAAMGGGGALGAVAGVARGRYGAHEVITTLMLNGLAAVFTTWLYSGPLRVGAQVHTRPVVAGARLPLAGQWVHALAGAGLNGAFVLSVLAALGAWLYLERTRGGLAIRALGASRGAVEALGLDAPRVMVRTMALSGALAGMVGAHFVLGVKGFAEQGMGAGVGFVGVAVAVLGNRHPAGVVLAALLFGALAQGGLMVNAIVPADVLAIAQAAVLVAVGALAARGRRGT